MGIQATVGSGEAGEQVILLTLLVRIDGEHMQDLTLMRVLCRGERLCAVLCKPKVTTPHVAVDRSLIITQE